MTMRKALEYGGIAAGVFLIALGIATIVLSVMGHNECHRAFSREQIVGSPDMTPEAIAQEAQDAGLPASIELPTCNVADKAIDTGRRQSASRTTCASTRSSRPADLTYAQMGRYQSAANPDDPKGTNDEAAAAKDENGQPVSNGAREHLGHGDLARNCALHVVPSGRNRAVRDRRCDRVFLAGIGFMVLAIWCGLRRGEGEQEAQPPRATRQRQQTS